jgi:hypothetical protein
LWRRAFCRRAAATPSNSRATMERHLGHATARLGFPPSPPGLFSGHKTESAAALGFCVFLDLEPGALPIGAVLVAEAGLEHAPFLPRAPDLHWGCDHEEQE